MSNVEAICGEYPSNFEKADIASDPNYSGRQLFDSEGSSVIVNSFVECEHYVAGGWGFTPIQSLEITLHNYLFIFVAILVGVRFILKKYKVF